VDDELWMFLMAFVHTRSWRELPSVEAFSGQFEEYMESFLALGYPKAVKLRATRALADLAFSEMVAIIDKAQDSIRSPVAATADATSVA
jgi:hypothetical protein